MTREAMMSEAVQARKKRPMRHRHCGKCELPIEICACAETRAYDKANPL